MTYRPYRAGMVLLAALVAYPALGPLLFPHLRDTAAADDQSTWPRFLDDLPSHPPRLTAAHRTDLASMPSASAGQAPLSPTIDQQWQHLIHGLAHITSTAAGHDLPLPEALTAWADWLIPVGRLSFPTGRLVTTLTPPR
jgi:hypothetical protein